MRCRAGGCTGCPVTVPKPHTQYRLSGRQPGQASRGIAPLIITPDTSALGHRSASARPPRREEHHLDHRSPPRWYRPAGRRVHPARPAARPRRSHRRRHRGTAAPLFDRPRARRGPAGRLQDPPRLPLPTVCGGVQRRYLPAHPRRAVWRQRCPRHCRHPSMRVHHPDRTVLRPGSPVPGERWPAFEMPPATARPDLPAWRPDRLASADALHIMHTPSACGLHAAAVW